MSRNVPFVLVLGVLVSVHAHAGVLQVEKALSAPVLTLSEAQQSNWSEPVITEVGSGHAPIITSKGSTGLLAATKMIVPKNWRVSAADGVNPNAMATWKIHDEPWTLALGQAVESAGMTASVVWAKKTVLIKPGAGVKPQEAVKKVETASAVSVAPTEQASAAPAATSVGIVPAQPAPLAVDVYNPAPPTFTLPAGPSLKGELSRYADSQGWSLRWNIDHDYRVDVPIPLKGDFYTSVTDLVKAYQALGGMAGVVPRFATSNKVLSIENLDHSTRQNQ